MADRYSFSLTTFSPSGKLAQIEYALAAVGQGLPSLGIRCSNGVVLASEKPHPSILSDQSSFEKISRITPDAGVVYSGMGPDFRVLVDKARKGAHANYLKVYNEYPPTRILVQDVAKVMQEATHSGGVRPYGVSLLLAGYTENPPHSQNPFSLYQIDPSGSYFPWRATAIGRNASSAKQFLEKRYNPEMELEDAIHTALLTLKEGFEGEMTQDTVEIGKTQSYHSSCIDVEGIVSEPAQHLLGYEGKKGVDGPRFRKLTPGEVQDYLDNL